MRGIWMSLNEALFIMENRLAHAVDAHSVAVHAKPYIIGEKRLRSVRIRQHEPVAFHMLFVSEALNLGMCIAHSSILKPSYSVSTFIMESREANANSALSSRMELGWPSGIPRLKVCAGELQGRKYAADSRIHSHSHWATLTFVAQNCPRSVWGIDQKKREFCNSWLLLESHLTLWPEPTLVGR